MARTKKVAEEAVETPVEEIVEAKTSSYEFPEEEDMAKFWENPGEACEGMQMKYIWMTPTQYKEYWDGIVDAEWTCPEGYVEDRALYTNIYTHEEKTVRVFREAPRESEEDLIARRIRELKVKVALGTATEEEKEALRLLVG